MNVVTSQLRQADTLGLKVGQHVIQVANKAYTRGSMIRAQKGSEAYSITLEEPSKLAIQVHKVAIYAKIPAGILGWLMLFSLPCTIYSRQPATSGWQLDVLSEVVVHTVAPLAAVASGAAQLLGAILDWRYESAIAKVHQLSHFCFLLGSLIGVRCFRNPLLQEPLDDDAARAVRRLDIAAAILSWLFVACDCTWGWSKYGPCTSESRCHGRLDIWHLLAAGEDSAAAYLLLTFTWAATRMSAVVQQRMVQLGKAMPCDSHEFAQRVHAPCADMLNDVGPKFGSFGWTLILLSPNLLTSCFKLYIRIHFLANLGSIAKAVHWLSPLSIVSQSVALFLAIVIGPFTLSAATKHLQRKLNESRCRDASLSIQVEGVERMIANLNDGQGFGIPVFGLVLTRSLLQTMLIRVVLAGTVIKAYVDTAEGFDNEEAEDEGLESQLTHVAALLQNITNASMALQQKSHSSM